MTTVLWIVQWMLAVFFLAHGVLHLVPPQALRKTMKRMPFSLGFLRFVGVAEILAAFGLVLPGLTGILTWLTPLAATGLVPIVSGAAVYHSSQREVPEALVTGVLLSLVVFLAWGRWLPFPL